MNLLSIDPGPVNSAFVIYDGQKVLDYGLWANDILLKCLERDVFNVHVDQVVIEMIASYGMAVGAEVFETCVYIGKIWQTIVLCREWPMELMYRKEVKMHVCGSMKAKDANIRQALIDRFGPQGTKKNPGALFGITKDKLAALALAVTYYDTKIKV